MGISQTTAAAEEGSHVTRSNHFTAGKPCDFCKSSPALLFCRPHSAFICISCDVNIHSAADKHARVWMCEVCEQAPAAVTCKADEAALCVTCDREIHCVNPLASRHDRVPVVPFHDSAENMVMKSTAVDFLSPIGIGGKEDLFYNHHGREGGEQNCYIPDSWIATAVDPPKLLLQNSDQFLDFDNRQIPFSQLYSDSVVPVQVKPPVHRLENQFEIDFSNFQSYNNSVSSSSMEVGVVPDGSSPSETSYPLTGVMNSNGNRGMDREARVMRYREKKKNRKFEKTIRYASRKAYAETRPRVKGRFAKRIDVDWILGGVPAHLVDDARYGIVPLL